MYNEMTGEDYIRINSGGKPRTYNISSNNSFFKSEIVVCVVADDKIVFSVPTIDFNGKGTITYEIKNTIKMRRVSLCTNFLPFGSFQIDKDESNEDQLVVYFEDKIEKQ